MILMMIIVVYLHTNYSDEVVQLVQLLYYLDTVVRYRSLMTTPFMQHSQSFHTQLWYPYKASQCYTQGQTVFSSYIFKIEGVAQTMTYSCLLNSCILISACLLNH